MNRDGGQGQSPETFVVDTHVLWWYFWHPDRLSVPAQAIFRLAETGNAVIIVPAIVVAEIYFLSVKLGQPFSPSDLFGALDGVTGIRDSDLGRSQLVRLDVLTDIGEMHDRLIAAEAMVRNAPLVTRDSALTASRHVTTVW